ncbi:MAG: DUF3306 domain-containing protein [Sulfitobacter sp.]|nr:DUF3306 domain-containing protein [Sulfitobacter sp.]
MSGRNDFWSRRRAAVEAEEQATRSAAEAEVLAAEQAVLAEKPEAEVLAQLGLPDPDTLGPGDDFTAFMAKAVPEAIRRRALRTLWRSNPVLANVDMLVDYGEDFTDSAMAVENIQTAYRVGKGMLKHIEEMARQAALEEETVTPDDTGDEETPEDLPADEPLAMAEAPYDHWAEETPEAEEPTILPTPRRMTFRIEETA